MPKSARGPVLSERKRVEGFTLVELLVVISIIAILSVIGLTVFTSVQKNARDTKRRVDIDAIAKAWEVNYGKCQAGMYCPLLATDFAAGAVPTDNTTAKYCINTAPDPGPPPAWPDTWTSTSECPASGYSSNLLEAFPAQGRPRWILCARLEASTGDTIVAGLKIYCKTNQQ